MSGLENEGIPREKGDFIHLAILQFGVISDPHAEVISRRLSQTSGVLNHRSEHVFRSHTTICN